MDENVEMLNTAQVGDLTPVGETGKKAGKKKAEKPVIDTMESLLLALLKNRKLPITDRILNNVKANLNSPSNAYSEFLKEALLVDPGLELGRHLMVTGLQGYSYPQVAEKLRTVARDLFLQHPTLKNITADLLFPSGADENAVRLSSVSQRLGNMREEIKRRRKVKPKLNPPSPGEKKNDDSRDEIRALENAMIAAAVWRLSLRLASTDEVVKCFQTDIFPCKVEGKQISIDFLSFLSNCPDRHGVSALMAWHADRLQQEISRSFSLSSQLDKKEREVARLADERDVNLLKMSELEKRIETLEHELSEERAQRTADCIHLRDERERQRVHSLKALDENAQLVSESLVALTREPPKVTVAEKYLSRVCDGLNTEIRYLKEC